MNRRAAIVALCAEFGERLAALLDGEEAPAPAARRQSQPKPRRRTTRTLPPDGEVGDLDRARAERALRQHGLAVRSVER